MLRKPTAEVPATDHHPAETDDEAAYYLSITDSSFDDDPQDFWNEVASSYLAK